MIDKFSKGVIFTVAFVIFFYLGFCYGQMATYKKLHDDHSIDDIYK